MSSRDRRGPGRGKGSASESGQSSRQRGAFSTSTASATLNEAQLSSIPELARLDGAPSQSSPNNSPASIPTETPAPTPAQASAPKAEYTGASRGRLSAAMSKFKPKAVRKSLAERERAEKEEQDRREREMRAAERRRGRGGRGNRGGRGRGDTSIVSLNRHLLGLEMASGPFGAAPSLMRKPQGKSIVSSSLRREGPSGIIGHTSGYSVSRVATDRSVTSPTLEVKSELGLISHLIGDGSGANYAEQPTIKYDFSEPIYPEDQQNNIKAVPKVNVDLINLIFDDEDDDDENFGNKGKEKPVVRGLRPVRIQRELQKEWADKIKSQNPVGLPSADMQSSLAETGTNIQDDGMFVPEIMNDEINRIAQREFIEEGRISSEPWQGTNFGIKYDPDGPNAGLPPEDKMDLDDHVPDLLANTLGVNDTATSSNQPSATDIMDSATKDASNISTRAAKKKSPPVFHSSEAKAEFMQNMEDAQFLLQELGNLRGTLGREAANGSGDVDGQAFTEDKEGRVYLFQIPPTIPRLVDPAKQKDVDKGVRSINTNQSTAAGAEIMDLTRPDGEEITVKIEPEQESSRVDPPLVPEDGYIGKLVVRASGRVEMDWGVKREDEWDTDDEDEVDEAGGGHDGDDEADEDAREGDEDGGSDEFLVLDRGDESPVLVLKRGIPVHFLQTAVLIDGDEEAGTDTNMDTAGAGAESRRKLEATGLGRIMGKFVTTPDFANVL